MNATKIATEIKIIGANVDAIPTERPEIMVVAEPVSDCSAIFLTYL